METFALEDHVGALLLKSKAQYLLGLTRVQVKIMRQLGLIYYRRLLVGEKRHIFKHFLRVLDLLFGGRWQTPKAMTGGLLRAEVFPQG